MDRVKQILERFRVRRIGNWKVIMLCLVGAMTFKFLNSMNKEYTTNIEYPIAFIFDEARYLIVDKLPEEIQLNLTGLGWNLLRVNLGGDVRPLSIPLENPAEVKKIVGSTLPTFFSNQLNDFKLNFVLTDTLYINIDHKDTVLRALWVNENRIDLKEGFGVYGAIDISPDTVSLNGPGTLLQALSDTLWINIPREGLEEAYSEDLSVAVARPDLIEIEPAMVTVSFKVEPFVEKTDTVSISFSNFLTSNWKVEDSTALVRYSVFAALADSIPRGDFVIKADGQLYNAADSTVTLMLEQYPEMARDVQLVNARIRLFPYE